MTIQKLFELKNTFTQSVIFPEDDTKLPMLFNNPVPYITVWYPTDEDVDTYHIIHLTTKEIWNVDLISLSHSISSLSKKDSIPNKSLPHNDLLEQLYDMI